MVYGAFGEGIMRRAYDAYKISPLSEGDLAACAIEKDVGQCPCPEKGRDLRQELVTDAVLHRDGSLEKRVDTIGEDVRALPARRNKTPVNLGTSAVC